MALNTPFPDFKTTGDDKHDIEVYIEDATDYYTMQNWFDLSKETQTAKWTKPEKVIACLRVSLSPANRAVYKYSLRLSAEDLAKPQLVVNTLREYYVASIGVSSERSFFACCKVKMNQSVPGKCVYEIKPHSANMRISLTSLCEISLSLA